MDPSAFATSERFSLVLTHDQGNQSCGSTRSVASFGPWFWMVDTSLTLQPIAAFENQDAFAGGCQGVSQGTRPAPLPIMMNIVTAWHGRASLQTWTALHEAAVGENRCCSDVAGSALGQHGNHTADLFRLSYSAQGYGGVEFRHLGRILHR